MDRLAPFGQFGLLLAHFSLLPRILRLSDHVIDHHH